MNISSHCFLPLTKWYSNKYYAANGEWSNVSQSSIGKCGSFMRTDVPVQCNTVNHFTRLSPYGASISNGKFWIDGQLQNSMSASFLDAHNSLFYLDSGFEAAYTSAGNPQGGQVNAVWFVLPQSPFTVSLLPDVDEVLF